eukprot:284819269_3
MPIPGTELQEVPTLFTAGTPETQDTLVMLQLDVYGEYMISRHYVFIRKSKLGLAPIFICGEPSFKALPSRRGCSFHQGNDRCVRWDPGSGSSRSPASTAQFSCGRGQKHGGIFARLPTAAESPNAAGWVLVPSRPSSALGWARKRQVPTCAIHGFNRRFRSDIVSWRAEALCSNAAGKCGRRLRQAGTVPPMRILRHPTRGFDRRREPLVCIPSRSKRCTCRKIRWDDHQSKSSSRCVASIGKHSLWGRTPSRTDQAL